MESDQTSETRTGLMRRGEGAGGPHTALEMFAAFLADGLHVDVERIARWIRAHGEYQHPLFRLGYGLRHVPPRGTTGGLTDSEADEVSRGILAEVEAHERDLRANDGDRSHATFDPLPAICIVSTFLKQSEGGRVETTLRWCRAFPDHALEIIEAASVLTLASLDWPTKGMPKHDEADRQRRREALLARAQSILDAEAQHSAGLAPSNRDDRVRGSEPLGFECASGTGR